MSDPQVLLSMPVGTPAWLGSWASAIFQNLLAPAVVGVIAARVASRQSRSAQMSERQKAGARLIDEMTQFGRSVDERLRACEEVGQSGRLHELPILSDVFMPECREAAATLGPKVAMQFQMTRDALAMASEELSYILYTFNKSGVPRDENALITSVTLATSALEDVLIQIYRSVDYAARSAKLPYRQNTRLSLKVLEKRRESHLRIVVHPTLQTKRLTTADLLHNLLSPEQQARERAL